MNALFFGTPRYPGLSGGEARVMHVDGRVLVRAFDTPSKEAITIGMHPTQARALAAAIVDAADKAYGATAADTVSEGEDYAAGWQAAIQAAANATLTWEDTREIDVEAIAAIEGLSFEPIFRVESKTSDGRYAVCLSLSHGWAVFGGPSGIIVQGLMSEAEAKDWVRSQHIAHLTPEYEAQRLAAIEAEEAEGLKFAETRNLTSVPEGVEDTQ